MKKFKGKCRAKLCNLIGVIDHSGGNWRHGFHDGLKDMYNYMIKNEVSRPKIEWVEDWIISECNKRTKSIRRLLGKCSRNKMCQSCKEKFKVIEKLVGLISKS